MKIFLQNLWRILTSRWVVTLIGVVLICLLIWFAGPLIGVGDFFPLEPVKNQAITMSAVMAVWLIGNLVAVFIARRKNKLLATQIGDSIELVADETELAKDRELEAIKRRLDEAVAKLQSSKFSSRFGKRHLYELPWYIIIGPPGSGKTTALTNSGLRFPLAKDGEEIEFRGKGGTRNCDWFFTNEAVLIDTAGRYVTQDSAREVDQAGWIGFLKMLKSNRSKQPINGAIVAIGLADLIRSDSQQRAVHASNIRDRLNELYRELGVRFPVYLLFTKGDLIAGFNEYFADLSEEERRQVWGLTYTYDEMKESYWNKDLFASEFDALIERLYEHVISRMGAEVDLRRKELIYRFPSQFASLKTGILEFLDDAFQASRFDVQPLLRGVYFTSGTQEGTPIDRIMGSLAQSLGVSRQQISAFSGRGRSYFIFRLLQDVVFGEANLVGKDVKLERRQMWFARLAYACAGLVLLASTTAWLISYRNNRELVTKVENDVDEFAKSIKGNELFVTSDSGLEQVLPVLNRMRSIPTGYDDQDKPVPLEASFFLYQGTKLGQGLTNVYHKGLNQLFLPRLIVRLEEQMREKEGDRDFLYEALKVYLMLGDRGPKDADLIKEWMAYDWEQRYSDPSAQRARQQLQNHLNALLAFGLDRYALNEQLIDDVRVILLSQSTASRAYQLIQQSKAARELGTWRVVDNIGPLGDRIIQRKSGVPLTDGVAGIYTYKGFHSVFLPSVNTAAQEVLRENWIYSDEKPAPLTAEERQKLERDLLTLYYTDYIHNWKTMLADVGLISMRNLTSMVDVLNALSSPNSPLKLLLTAAGRETALTRADADDDGTGNNKLDAAKKRAKKGFSSLDRLGKLFKNDEETVNELPGEIVEKEFVDIHQQVFGTNEKKPPIDDTIALLNQLYLQLNKSVETGRGGQLGSDIQASGAVANVIRQVRVAATRLPAPVAEWLVEAANRSSGAMAVGARDELNKIWKSGAYRFCVQATSGRYPFNKGGSREVTLPDFERLFAPGGLIDSFFTTHLQPFVDMSRRPWRWEEVDGAKLNLSKGALLQFQRAAEIRDSFFGSGSLSVGFVLTPRQLDANAASVFIDINGQSLTYNHGPQRGARFKWPSAEGRARVAFTPTDGGATASVTKQGSWALFRLNDMARKSKSGGREYIQVEFSIGNHRAQFDLRADTVLNPFTLSSLRSFRCPFQILKI